MLPEIALSTLIISSFYLLGNLICLFLYAWDKQAAIRGTLRISEKNLMLWTMISGGLGAVAAQQVLRHKTQKAGFQVIACLALLLHIAFWVWQLTQ